MEEMISIIAPAFNHEKYINKALESVNKQSYPNKELIIIDDFSTDNTSEKIEQFISQTNVKENFPGGITFIKHKKNMNAPDTLNEGIGIAKGKYISIINTDDMYEPNRLEIMLKKMKEANAQFAFSNVQIINEKNEITKYDDFERMFAVLKKLPRCSLALAIENMGISTGNYIFEKKLYNLVGGFNRYHFIHDWDFILRVCLKTEPLYIESTNYIYRFHETNTMKQISESFEKADKKEKEVYNVLYDYLNSIVSEKNKNNLLAKCETWDYFFENVVNCYAGEIWKEIRGNN